MNSEFIIEKYLPQFWQFLMVWLLPAADFTQFHAFFAMVCFFLIHLEVLNVSENELERSFQAVGFIRPLF